MRGKLKRREWLRHAGFSALVFPLLRYWEDLGLAASVNPARMLLVFTPNGKHKQSIFVEPTTQGFNFGPSYSALDSFKSEILAFRRHSFEGILQRNKLLYSPSGTQSDGHHHTAKTIFSGHSPIGCTSQSPAGPQAPTIDQIAAEELLIRGLWTNPSTVALNARLVDGGWFDGHIFHTATGYTQNKVYEGGNNCPGVSTIGSPLDAFKKFFASLATPEGTPSGFDKLWARGGSMLDAPMADLQSLQATLPAEGRALLAMHLDGLRKLEVSMQAEQRADSAFFDISKVKEPSVLTKTPANYQAILEQWHTLIGHLFRADRTRIVTLQYAGSSGRFNVPALSLPCIGECGPDGKPTDPNSGQDHHSYTHHGTMADNEKFQNWYSQRMAHLLQILKTGDGSDFDVLKDSVVMWGMEHGDAGGHSSLNTPFLIAGGAGGTISTGRVIDNRNDSKGHVGALKAALHAFGLSDLTHVGCAEFNEPGTGEFTSNFIRGK